MSNSWMTTVLGIIISLAAFVANQPDLFPPWAVGFAKYLTSIGIAGFGLVAKDYNKTGTGR